MEYDAIKKEIRIDREMNNLDKFVYDFVSLLNGQYVLVLGYVSIITGRSRATEDVDLVIPKMDFACFKQIWGKVHDAGFECINTENAEEAYEMLNLNAIRFAVRGRPIPNMEFKISKDKLGEYSLQNKIKVFIKDKLFYVSELEMQIAYKKAYLGSPKDNEDALHLEVLFKDKLNFKKIEALEKLVREEKKNG